MRRSVAQIDRALAKHYGFTDDEPDFIPSTSLRAGINYDTCRQADRSSTG